MRLDAHDEARDKVEDARGLSAARAGIEIERHVEQSLERIEEQRGGVRQLVEQEPERCGKHARALVGGERHARGRHAARLFLPRAGLEEGGLEHLLHTSMREGRQALLVGEEL